jgi:hypothetical protein
MTAFPLGSGNGSQVQLVTKVSVQFRWRGSVFTGLDIVIRRLDVFHGQTRLDTYNSSMQNVLMVFSEMTLVASRYFKR